VVENVADSIILLKAHSQTDLFDELAISCFGNKNDQAKIEMM